VNERAAALGAVDAALKAVAAERDAVVHLAHVVNQINALVFDRLSRATKLRSRVANPHVPLAAAELGERLDALTRDLDPQLAQAYADLIRAIETLPLASRDAAFAKLCATLRPTPLASDP